MSEHIIVLFVIPLMFISMEVFIDDLTSYVKRERRIRLKFVNKECIRVIILPCHHIKRERDNNKKKISKAGKREKTRLRSFPVILMFQD